MFINVILSTFLVVNLVSLSISLIAYDCNHDRANITTVSLLDPKTCTTYNSSEVSSYPIQIQIIQEKEWVRLHVSHCKIEILKTINYCGMHSHISNVATGLMKFIYEIDQPECDSIHSTHTFIYEGSRMSGIRNNATQYFHITLAGFVGYDGTCNGVSYASPTGSYTNAIVQASITITLKDYYTTYQTSTNEIVFNDGTVCNTNNVNCLHPIHGFTTWNAPQGEACDSDSRDVLYQGKAFNVGLSDDITLDSIIMVNSETSLYSLKVLAPTHICYQQAFKTDHPRIYVIERTSFGFYFNKNSIDPRNVDLALYMNAKISFVFQHIERVIKEVYIDLVNRDCNLEYSLLSNKIKMARTSPLMFGNLITDEQGYYGVVAGEVMHMIKCQAVEVKIRRSPYCYTNLPILYNNMSTYLEPFSRIITNTSMEVPCSPLSPSMFKIGDEWYAMTPSIIRALTPLTLEPKTKPNSLRYSNINNLMQSGIYDQKTMSSYREFMSFPLIKLEANAYISSKLSQGSVYASSSYDTMNLIDQVNFEKRAKKAFHALFGWVATFGTYAGAVWGAFMIYKIICKVFNTIINGLALHDMFGCTYHILACFMTSVTHFLTMKRVTRDIRDETSTSHNIPMDELAPSSSAPPCHLMDDSEVTILMPTSPSTFPKIIPP